MAGKSNIEWTGWSWNPFAGCRVLSPGCTNCYAMKMAARLDAMGQPLYKGLTKPSKAGPVWRGTVRMSPDALLAPLKRKKPTTYFVNSMSDLFYDLFSDDLIDQVFAIMAMCPQHTFQVLTKRARRMRDYFFARPYDLDQRLPHFVQDAANAIARKLASDDRCWAYLPRKWPLPNVWLGVSAERQQEADERIPLLLQTPAAVRFVSAEPLLGPIKFRETLGDDWLASGKSGERRSLDWIIVGGESGSKARPFKVEWADRIVAQCNAAGTACFVKQFGSAPLSDGYPMHLNDRKGGTPEEWPERLRIRDMPQVSA